MFYLIAEKVWEKTYTGRDERGWDFNGYLKTGMRPQTLPHPGFGTGMENNYIFWDGNGIGEPVPNPPRCHPYLKQPHNLDEGTLDVTS